MLTTLQIKSAKAQERAYKLADSGGLYLLVQPNGSKLWRYKFRVGGVEGKQSFGAFPEVSLAEARGLHGDSRKLVVQGINPVQTKQELKVVQAQEQLERTKGTFAAVMSDWDTATAAGLRPSTVQLKRVMRKRVSPSCKWMRGWIPALCCALLLCP